MCNSIWFLSIFPWVDNKVWGDRESSFWDCNGQVNRNDPLTRLFSHCGVSVECRTYWCHYITLSVQVQSSAGVWASLHPAVTCHTAYYPRRGELSEKRKKTIWQLLTYCGMNILHMWKLNLFTFIWLFFILDLPCKVDSFWSHRSVQSVHYRGGL